MGEDYNTLEEIALSEDSREITEENATEEAVEEELSDAEFAELIGEEDIQENGQEEPKDIESTTPAPEEKSGKKKRQTKKRVIPAVGEDQEQEEERRKRKVHAIGGTDTLKTGTSQTGASQMTGISAEASETVSEALKSTVKAGIAGTRTAEGVYKDCIILPHSRESQPYDSRNDQEVLQKNGLVHSSREESGESFHITALDKALPRSGEEQTTRHYEERRVLTETEQKELLFHSTERIAEKAASWKKEQVGEAPIRKFSMHRPTTIIRDMERGGRSFHRAVRSFASGQDTAEQTGERNLRKYLGAAGDVTDLLAVLGGRATADIQKARSRSFAESAVNMERAMESGKLKQSDLLLSREELKEKIRKTGLKPYESWGIVKNCHAIHDALVTKEVLLKLKDESPDQKHVFARTKVLGRNVIGVSAYESKKQVGLLTSDTGKFYNDYKFSAWTRNMIRTWFASQPDPMLRKLNPAGMSIREI